MELAETNLAIAAKEAKKLGDPATLGLSNLCQIVKVEIHLWITNHQRQISQTKL
jgi:hypothetical protein